MKSSVLMSPRAKRSARIALASSSGERQAVKLGRISFP